QEEKGRRDEDVEVPHAQALAQGAAPRHEGDGQSRRPAQHRPFLPPAGNTSPPGAACQRGRAAAWRGLRAIGWEGTPPSLAEGDSPLVRLVVQLLDQVDAVLPPPLAAELVDAAAGVAVAAPLVERARAR